MKKLALLAAVMLSTSGCNTLSNGYAAEKAPTTLSPESGLVVISTGGIESCGTSAIALYFQPLGSAYQEPQVAGPNVNWGAFKSDFPDRRGALNVIALKAGSYQMSPRPIDWNMRGERIPKAEFSLAAGEVLYLGEYYVTSPCSRSVLSEFRDREERDMALLMQRRPDLAALPHVKRIPSFTGYLLEPVSDPVASP